MDKHFRDAPFESNIPVQLGLASIWNVSFLGYAARAILPYTQALSKLAPHIQQVDMISTQPSSMHVRWQALSKQARAVCTISSLACCRAAWL